MCMQYDVSIFLFEVGRYTCNSDRKRSPTPANLHKNVLLWCAEEALRMAYVVIASEIDDGQDDGNLRLRLASLTSAAVEFVAMPPNFNMFYACSSEREQYGFKYTMFYPSTVQRVTQIVAAKQIEDCPW